MADSNGWSLILWTNWMFLICLLIGGITDDDNFLFCLFGRYLMVWWEKNCVLFWKGHGAMHAGKLCLVHPVNILMVWQASLFGLTTHSILCVLILEPTYYNIVYYSVKLFCQWKVSVHNIIMKTLNSSRYIILPNKKTWMFFRTI